MFSKSLKQIISLSLSTTGSRFLGLFRDATLFSTLGNSVFSSAFIIAFTIPNLFRRLLGEGALSSAFVPVFSKEQSSGNGNELTLLNQTITRLGLYFGLFIFISICTLTLLEKFIPFSDSWQVAMPLLKLLLPYALLICIAAVLTAALNCLGKFFIPSFSPILLNICMITALIVGSSWFKQSPHHLTYTLSFAVLLGGLLQLALPAIQMSKLGWKAQINRSNSEALAQVKTLFLTATGGAAIIQINILITRIIAYQISDEAVAQLYLASRLTELPLGVFAVAIYTVIFPLLSRFQAENKTQAFAQTSLSGCIMMLAITIPATIGLALLAKPILSLLFEWGRYSKDDVLQTTPVLIIYSTGIPFYALVAYFTRIFHAKQNMGIPVKVSFAALFVNISLSLILMQRYGVTGLAWANVITSTAQTLTLGTYLHHREKILQCHHLLIPILKLFIAAGLMSLLTIWLTNQSGLSVARSGKGISILLLLGTIIPSAICYTLSCWMLGLKKFLIR